MILDPQASPALSITAILSDVSGTKLRIRELERKAREIQQAANDETNRVKQRDLRARAKKVIDAAFNLRKVLNREGITV